MFWQAEVVDFLHDFPVQSFFSSVKACRLNKKPTAIELYFEYKKIIPLGFEYVATEKTLEKNDLLGNLNSRFLRIGSVNELEDEDDGHQIDTEGDDEKKNSQSVSCWITFLFEK